MGWITSGVRLASLSLLVLLLLVLSACGSSSTSLSHIVSVAGSVGPLRVDESSRGQVLAYAGKPDVERQGHGEGARYDVLGYDY